MNPIAFSSWEGASTVFTFGPDSAGMWLFLAGTVAVGIGVLARMIIHENRTFSSLDPNLVVGGAIRGANI